MLCAQQLLRSKIDRYRQVYVYSVVVEEPQLQSRRNRDVAEDCCLCACCACIWATLCCCCFDWPSPRPPDLLHISVLNNCSNANDVITYFTASGACIIAHLRQRDDKCSQLYYWKLCFNVTTMYKSNNNYSSCGLSFYTGYKGVYVINVITCKWMCSIRVLWVM